ncbi:hypothetical protein QAD02_007860 [Eretmocerus hayati]|uniref:Uncharacterized protein n=1 Tax=Eretmocerus hayati TaxID=131215 RepID=A0ACC2N655_9HYME|nr:hypothetical protein QAD02_007860 [Eretmocerus hayati]
MMSEKAERVALLNRVRVQKHRENNKRLKLEASSFEPYTLGGLSSGQDGDEVSNKIPGIGPCSSGNSAAVELQTQNVHQSLESSNSGVTQLNSETSSVLVSLCNYQHSDDENDSQESLAECSASDNIDGKDLKT